MDTTGKTPGQARSVVQHEGFLLKRGAGYDPDDEDKAVSMSSAASTSGKSTVIGGFVNNIFSNLDQLGKEEKKRYFILVTTNAASYTASDVLKAKAGVPEPSGSQVGGEKVLRAPPKAELKYYAKGKPASHATVKPKGVIVLSADTKVEVSNSVLMLKTPGRTYYLRPNVSEDFANSAHARTNIAQWQSAIEFAIQGLKAWELSNAVGGHHPMQDRRSIRGLTGLDVGGGEIPSSPGAVEMQRKRTNARRSIGGGDQVTPVSGNFAELWGSHGIQAYNEVIAHFGRAQLDMQRLREHYASRLRQIRADQLILEEISNRSQEFVASEQRTTRHAVQDLNRSLEDQRVHVLSTPEKLEKEILKPLDDVENATKAKLESIVALHSVATSKIMNGKRDLEVTIENIRDLNLRLKEMSEDAETQAKIAEVKKNKRRPSGNIFRGAKSQGPTTGETREELEDELNEERKKRREQETSLMEVESVNAAEMIKAMNALEALEIARLKKVRDIMVRASTLEMEFVQGLSIAATRGHQADIAAAAPNASPQKEEKAGEADTGTLLGIIEAIDAPKDIKASFRVLKEKAEKTRPAGKLRKKNSITLKSSVFLSNMNIDLQELDIQPVKEE